MKKIAITYSFHTNNTAKIADLIAKKLGNKAEKLNIEEASVEDFMEYEYYILGSSTWFEGELPNHWDEFLPSIEDEDFSGKKFAFYGLGDQLKYPDFFGDAIAKLADFVEERGGKLLGRYPKTEYYFDHSKALRGGELMGVLLDYENQSNLVESRLDEWIRIILSEFK